MIRALLATALLLLSGAAGAATQNYTFTISAGSAAPGEEFVGPFPSWVCARTSASGTCGAATAAYCNAVADGTTSDASPIQTCLNSLSASRPNIHFPAGTYAIAPVTTTGTAASGSYEVAVASTTGIVVGMHVRAASGPTAGIPLGNTVVAISGSIILIRYPTTTSLSSTALIFGLGLSGRQYTLTTATGSSGGNTITVASTTGLTTEMHAAGNGIPSSLFCRITNIAGNVLTLSDNNNNPCNLTASMSSTRVAFFNAGATHISLIGADPATTTLKWTGGSTNAPLIYINGANYSRFNRLTFDGQSTAVKLVDQSKADSASSYFDTGNEYADDVFKDAGIGIECGGIGFGCAETSVLRSKFINNTTTGIFVGNYNALNMWVWYSVFQNNTYGVTNNTQAIADNRNFAGQFQIFNNIFLGSTLADIKYGNVIGTWNIRNNYSSGSKYFMDAGGSGTVVPVNIQGNTILDTTQALSMWIHDTGPSIFIDNIVRTSAAASPTDFGNSTNATSTTGPVIVIGNNHGDNTGTQNLFSMGNTFTVGSGSCSTTSPTFVGGVIPGHCHGINDQIVSRSTVNPTMPTLPGLPPNNGRTIYGVAALTGAAIQAQINAAVSGGTTRPVVHLPPGDYSVTSTITVSANSDVQIIGDGGHTRLVWSGGGAGPVLRLLGPSKAILGYFNLSGGATADGIEIENADQVGSRVFIEQSVIGSSTTALFVDALDYTNVELHDFTHGNTTNSVIITGGPSAASGTWLGGQTNIFAGDSFHVGTGYTASNGGHLSVMAMWTEIVNTRLVSVSGASTVTMSGNWTGTDTHPFAAISALNGSVAFTGNSTSSADTNSVSLSGDGSLAKFLSIGTVTPSSTPINNTTSPAATTMVLNGMVYGAYTELAESGCCDATFLTTTLKQLRVNNPSVPAPSPPGRTDVRMYHVSPGFAATGIHVKN